jgi:2-keto-3-deoxy-L-rhamnonate aldolase RhmA
MKNSNNHICLIAQIESVEGLNNIEEIAAMPEVDALVLGPRTWWWCLAVSVRGAGCAGNLVGASCLDD